MTKLLIPSKVKIIKNLQEREILVWHKVEASQYLKKCSKCFAWHERTSAFCQLCSDEYHAGDEETYKVRLNKNTNNTMQEDTNLEDNTINENGSQAETSEEQAEVTEVSSETSEHDSDGVGSGEEKAEEGIITSEGGEEESAESVTSN